MAHLIEFDDWREGYVQVVKHVASRGQHAPSRGGDTLEIRDFMFTLDAVSIDLPLGTGRRINTSLAAAEAIQLCAGVGMPDLTEAVSRQVASFVRDPDGTVHGNYGARVADQIDDVVHKFIDDPSSRQAIIQIWDKREDSRYRHVMPKDIPCTIAIAFGVEPGGFLTMSVMMRSNDVWLGLPFDVFQFRQLQRTMARRLRLEMGVYAHHAVSMHLYQRDIQKVADLIVDQLWEPKSELPHGIYKSEWAPLDELFHAILRGDDEAVRDPSNAWYHAALGDAYATIVG